jgi:hypothetical protein
MRLVGFLALLLGAAVLVPIGASFAAATHAPDAAISYGDDSDSDSDDTDSDSDRWRPR